MHQPYHAPFLARLATFILHAPLSTVKSAFAPTSTCASDDGASPTCSPPCDIESLCIDPNVLLPSATVNATCQLIPRLLNAHFPRSQSSSPDTLPLALCLLYRFRCASSEVKSVYSDVWGIPCLPPSIPVSDPILVPYLSDETLIAVAVHIAYKFLAIDFHYENLFKWAPPLELNKKSLLEAEWLFLGAIDYRVWVGEEEGYVGFRGRCENLWEEVFKRAKRAEAPSWLRFKTAK